jgi:hypothetical protein
MSDKFPTMTQKEIHEHSDQMFVNGVGFALAYAGLERVNELAELVGVPAAQDNVMEAVQNILSTFHSMNVVLDLQQNQQFTCTLTFHMDTDGAPSGVTLQ